MDKEKIAYYGKIALIVISFIVLAVTIIMVINKLRKNRSAKKIREEMIKTVVSEATTPDKKSYGSVAVQLEKLIFNRHSKLYGWEADVDGILKLFADYSKQDVDKVLEAYSIIYPPSESGGTYIGEVLQPLDYLFAPRKTYTGNAINDLKNIEDEKDFEKVMLAYKNLK